MLGGKVRKINDKKIKTMKKHIKFFEVEHSIEDEYGMEFKVNNWIDDNNVIVDSIQFTSHFAGTRSVYGIAVLYHNSEE